MPMLNDSGATCSCIIEEQFVIIANHTFKMVEDGKMTTDDYNYPIAQLYSYQNTAELKGAEKTGVMKVEYAVLLRIEFILEGMQKRPVKEIYFKIFKKGTCGIVGGVFGWPTLDHPQVPGGEGLG